MRYAKPLLQLPSNCDGCSTKFSLDHALNCTNGGNLIQHHNEVRDMTGQLVAMAFSHITKEPVVREYGSSAADGGALTCDLAVRRMWNPQTEVLLDIHMVNTDAQLYASLSVTSVLDSIARAKKTKHCQACVQRRADFMPFNVSTDGVIQWQGQHFFKRLATKLVVK